MFLNYNTLSFFLIKFKYMITLTNEEKTILSPLRIIKYIYIYIYIVMCLNLIDKSNVLL